MSFYINIQMIESQEISLPDLWGEVYYKLHLLLSSKKDENDSVKVGVSFPDYGKREGFVLGNRIRLHAENAKILEDMNLKDHFNRLSEYMHITSIRNVPEDVNTFVSFHRIQYKTNINYLIRRCAERHNITIAEATEKYKNFKMQNVDTPYILLKSGSNHNKFRLHIKKKNSERENLKGFSVYGLSEDSAVPFF